MLPAAKTVVDTVMTAARARILPDGVSTLTPRLPHPIRLAGVDSATGTCSPSFAINVPSPWRQAIAVLRSCARDLSPTEISFRSLPEKLAPSTNSAVSAQMPEVLRQDRRAGDVEAARGVVDRAVARTSAARNSSISPGRALRRPMRIFCPCGAVLISSPADRASLINGLVSGLCIQRAPRSNGTSNVERSVWQRPPIWFDASTTITLRFAAMMRRAAAMPAAPAPTTTISASRGKGAAPARPPDHTGVPPARRTPTGNGGGSLSCHGFRGL